MAPRQTTDIPQPSVDPSTEDNGSPTTNTAQPPVNTNLQAIIYGVQAIVEAMPALMQVAATCQVEVMKTELQILEHKMAFLEKTAGTIPEAMKFSILVSEIFPGAQLVDLPDTLDAGDFADVYDRVHRLEVREETIRDEVGAMRMKVDILYGEMQERSR